MTRRLANFIDIESTGVNEPEERIIEIACQLADLDTEQLVAEHVWRCNPLRKINAKAQKVHGIRLDELEHEPLWDQVAPLVRGVIEDPEVQLMVAHNGDFFDFPFIDRELVRVGHQIVWPRKFDTMTNARWATANGKNPRLGELATCLDIPYDPSNAHAASYDVSVMRLSFFEARRIGFLNI